MNLLNSILEADSAVLNNIDVDYTTNMLHDIQESCEEIQPLKFTAEMVPVYESTTRSGDTVYCMELRDVKRLMESCDCSVEDAMKMMQDSLIGLTDLDITIKDLCVTCNKEDCAKLCDACKKDITKTSKLLSKVAEHTNLLVAIQKTGANIAMIAQ